MRTKAAISVLLVVGLVGMLLGSMGSAAAKAKKAGPMVVGTDPADDWGSNAGVPAAPGDALGQELVEAAIGADGKTVNFVITVNSLPPWGGIPEITRYNWDFMVNGNPFQLTGGFTEYLRGTCNPLHTGACPPPQDPGSTPFMLRTGPCLVGEDCFLHAIYSATFDPATGSITIPVPMADIKAKPGSKIAPGASTFGGTIYAAPAAMVSSTAAPADIMIITKTYTVPK